MATVYLSLSNGSGQKDKEFEADILPSQKVFGGIYLDIPIDAKDRTTGGIKLGLTVQEANNLILLLQEMLAA